MEYLIVIRIIGVALGTFFTVRSFAQFRHRIIKRSEFFFLSAMGIAILTVSVYPDSINIVAGMMALDNRQYGRLITVMIISNMLLWLLIVGLRNRDMVKSVQFDLLIRRIAMERFFEKDPSHTLKEITVIIPALNEAANLDHVLPRIPDDVLGYSIAVLVVDDGSTDDTLKIVEKHGYSVVSNIINRGGGAALRLGYDIAMTAGAKYIVTMDADGQHLPEEIEVLVAELLKNDLDIVIGSRVKGKREKDNVFRWIGVNFFNFVINLLAGTRITDCSSGFRIFKMESLKNILLIQDQFHTAELIIDAAKKGLKIGDAPITMLRRHSGESKKGKDISYGINFSKTVLKSWLRK